MARSQTLFPENPSVWVKDLAGYLNLKLTAPETEITLSSYTHGKTWKKQQQKNIRLCLNQFVQNLICPHFSAPLFPPDYPYCLTGKELRGVIKGLIGRCSDILPDFFDYCVYTMLRELDRNSGKKKKSASDIYLLSARHPVV